jgi:hypothetical protein
MLVYVPVWWCAAKVIAAKFGASRRALPVIVIGSLMFGMTVASAPGLADRLPERKPGHWRITSVSAELGMTEIDACLSPGDSIAIPSAGSDCSVPDVRHFDDQVIVNVTCRSKLGEERISTLYTGDFQSWYRGITKMTLVSPTYGQAAMAVTVDAKYVGHRCPRS